jgi:Predicted endonuclease distantly related to archaeal Holliday junction resolvase
VRLLFTPKRKAYLKGRYGEWIAACYLWGLGYEILKTRLKTPFGEIDLLVKKKETLIAVEVQNPLVPAPSRLFLSRPFNSGVLKRLWLTILSTNPKTSAFDLM